MIDPTIRVGDVVTECVLNAPCYVVDLAADSVAAYNERSSLDEPIETYGLNPLFTPSQCEPVWTVVVLQADVTSTPRQTYIVLDSRLVRYPVEAVDTRLRRVQDAIVVDVLEHLFVIAARSVTSCDRTMLADLVLQAGIPQELLDEAIERADSHDVIGGEQ